MSVLIVKVLGFEVLPSFQWSNWYPLFAVAEITAVESVQVAVSNIETLPIALSADMAEIVERKASLKFEK